MAAELKNARRRRNRLTKRARQLSTEDLLTVVALREADAARRSVDSAAAPLADGNVEEEEDDAEDDERVAAAASEDEDGAGRKD